MKTLHQFFFLLLLLGLNSYAQPKRDTIPLLSKDTSNSVEISNNLIVFIGEKIYVKEVKAEKQSMDRKYIAKYKVLKNVYGNYSPDTIDFIVYSHRGFPQFARRKEIMLYISIYQGQFYHEKYIYDDIYKTKSGRWAGTFQAGDDKPSSPVKPEIIDFAEKVSLDISGKSERELEIWYPEPFYKRVGNKAIAVYGNYIEELFERNKQGVLKNRGLF